MNVKAESMLAAAASDPWERDVYSETTRTRPVRAQLAAPGSGSQDAQIDALAVDFFNRTPEVEAFEPAAPRAQLPREQRLAMLATFVMLVISLFAIGGYLVYARLIMPTPVELPSAAEPQLPLPIDFGARRS